MNRTNTITNFLFHSFQLLLHTFPWLDPAGPPASLTSPQHPVPIELTDHQGHGHETRTAKPFKCRGQKLARLAPAQLWRWSEDGSNPLIFDGRPESWPPFKKALHQLLDKEGYGWVVEGGDVFCAMLQAASAKAAKSTVTSGKGTNKCHGLPEKAAA